MTTCRKCGAVEQEREVMETEYRWLKEGPPPAEGWVGPSSPTPNCSSTSDQRSNGSSTVSLSARRPAPAPKFPRFIGYEFEFSFPPRGRSISGYGNIDIHTYRVVGWEKQIDGSGNERVSVRTRPVASRVRRVISFSFGTCNLGHVHEVFEYDDNTPPKGEAPEIWGFG